MMRLVVLLFCGALAGPSNFRDFLETSDDPLETSDDFNPEDLKKHMSKLQQHFDELLKDEKQRDRMEKAVGDVVQTFGKQMKHIKNGVDPNEMEALAKNLDLGKAMQQLQKIPAVKNLQTDMTNVVGDLKKFMAVALEDSEVTDLDGLLAEGSSPSIVADRMKKVATKLVGKLGLTEAQTKQTMEALSQVLDGFGDIKEEMSKVVSQCQLKSKSECSEDDLECLQKALGGNMECVLSGLLPSEGGAADHLKGALGQIVGDLNVPQPLSEEPGPFPAGLSDETAAVIKENPLRSGRRNRARTTRIEQPLPAVAPVH